MLRRFFNPESGIWKPLGFVGDLVMLSLFWCLCSIPLLTLGPATAALYDTVVHAMRRKDSSLFTRYFESFRRELKEGVLLTLLWALAAAALGFALYGLFTLVPALGERGALVSFLELLAVLFYLGAASWVFPTLSRFTMGVGALSGACLRLAAGHALRSAALALLGILVIFTGTRFVVPLMFAPALAAWLASFLLEPVYKQYESPAAEERTLDPGLDREEETR